MPRRSLPSHRRLLATGVAGLLMAGTAWGSAAPAAATAGTVDTDFLTAIGVGPINAAAPATTPQGTVYSTAELGDGTLLIGGLFQNWNTTATKYLAVLGSDGTTDTSFLGTAGHSVSNILPQSDGTYVISGSFTNWGGASPRGLTKVNADGTLNSAFSANAGAGTNNTVSAIAQQTDGDILVGGGFSTWNGTTVGKLLRVNADGTRDAAFDVTTSGGANGTVRAIAVQSDGSILAGGALTAWNGTAVGRLARVSSTGALDTGFNTAIGLGSPAGDIYDIEVLGDGSMLVGGDFTTWDTTTGVGRLVKLDSSGNRDTAFSSNVGTGANARLRKIVPLSAGGFLIVGEFTDWNGTTVGRAVALNDDGSLNTDLTTALGNGADNRVYTAAELADGDLLIGGSFTTWETTAVPGLVRIASGGAGSGGVARAATSSDPSGGVPPVLQQYILDLDQSADADSCATNAPAHVVDDRTTSDQRYEGWSVSYAQWPHDGSGGWVCTRTLHYRAASDMWITGSSAITGSGDLQQYAIPPLVNLRDSAAEDLTDAQVRTAYCRANAPDDPTLGSTWGARNEGWRPTYAEWAAGGTGGWVCSRTT